MGLTDLMSKKIVALMIILIGGSYAIFNFQSSSIDKDGFQKVFAQTSVMAIHAKINEHISTLVEDLNVAGSIGFSGNNNFRNIQIKGLSEGNIKSVTWLSPDASILYTEPSRLSNIEAIQNIPTFKSSLQKAKENNDSVIYVLPGIGEQGKPKDIEMAIFTPIWHGNTFLGYVVGRLDFDRIMYRALNFFERNYYITIKDSSGKVIYTIGENIKSSQAWKDVAQHSLYGTVWNLDIWHKNSLYGGDYWRFPVIEFILLMIITLLISSLSYFVGNLYKSKLVAEKTAEALKNTMVKYEATREKLTIQANYDSVTGLQNRDKFQESLQSILKETKKNFKIICLMFLEIDFFDDINNTFGYEAGDLLLRRVALRLNSCVGDQDIVGRTGGNQFGILLAGMSEDLGGTIMAQKLLLNFQKPFDLNGHETHVALSIGIAVGTGMTADAKLLSKQAHIALYEAKKSDTERFKYFSSELNALVQKRVKMSNSLYRATTNQEFVLFYQPQVDVKTGALTGTESLIRWSNDEFGFVSPSEFIPILEETGLILSVGQWILNTACKQHKIWQDKGLLPPSSHVSVNVSTRQFKGYNLVTIVKQALNESGLNPKSLVIEITESLLAEDSHATLGILEELSSMGIKISLDDFGTGYSSLSYLKRFPIDMVKIDQSFIKDVIDNEHHQVITSAIIALSHKLNLEVVAEGVENREIISYLREQGCNFYQGFYCAKPLNPAEFDNFVKQYTLRLSDQAPTNITLLPKKG